MEISPAKSLGIVSDSEGEEDNMTSVLDMLEREPNAARLSGPRDRHSIHIAATIATNYSSHISQFSTPLPEPPMAIESSTIQTDSDWSATKPRARPRPRMRPVPPPDEPEPSSIGAFSALQPTMAATEAIASFDNSAVQGVPMAHPPSLPPSSLPTAETSSSMPIPTFPVSPQRRAPANIISATPTHNIPGPSSGSAVPPSITMDQPTPPVSKRPRPKMRPPPPPELEPVPATANTITSSTTTNSSANPNPSTAATSVSGSSKQGDATRRSALDEAEEYTGRGARRLAQQAKEALPPDVDVDVGGPEDNIIMLLSSDGEYDAGKSKAKPKAKPKPKPKKKEAPKGDLTSAQLDPPDEHTSAIANSTSSTTGTSKRRSSQPQSTDDEFGRWDMAIPGASASTSTKSRKRKKINSPNPEDEGMSGTRPVDPARVPNTIDPPYNPPNDPSNAQLPSSPLSSPGHSPSKRKDPPDSLDEEAAPTSTKKSRKNALVGVVLNTPTAREKKPKGRTKKSAKAAADGDSAPSALAQEIADEQAYVPPALSSVGGTSSSGLQSESSKAKTTPPTSSGVPPPGDSAIPKQIVEPTTAPMDVENSAPATKKQPKKRAPKGKKGATTEDPTPTDAQEAPATTKKGAKGKSKAKAKETDATSDAVDTGGASSSNPDAGPTTLSNPGVDAGPQPASSNSSAVNQTPAPKSRTKPRHSTTPAPLPVAMGASGALLKSTGSKSVDRPLSETIRLALGGSSTPSPRMGLSRRGSSKIAPLLAFRGVPPPPPPPLPKKPSRKKAQSDDEDSEEGPEWEGLTEKQKEKKRREKEMAGWYSDG